VSKETTNELMAKIKRTKTSPVKQFLSPYEEEERTFNDNLEEEQEKNINQEIDINAVINDVLNKQNKHQRKEYVGFYLEEEVIKGLNKLCGSHTRKTRQGIRSEIANAIFKAILKEKGLIK